MQRASLVSYQRSGECLAGGEKDDVTDPQTVLFICTHNAGRSQLGAHLLARHAGDRLIADSAGVHPAAAINPAVAATLDDLGIDTSAAVPRGVTPDDLANADVVVLMKPGLELPGPVSGELVQWEFPDPADWSVDSDSVRDLRESVDLKVRALAARLLE